MTQTVKAEKLERRLGRRIVQIQAVALLLFFGVVIIPLAVIPAMTAFNGNTPLDPLNTANLASAIQRNAAGKLTFDATHPSAASLIADAPNVWFYAETPSGEVLTYGNIPPAYRPIIDLLGELDTGMISPNSQSVLSTMQIWSHKTDVGEIVIASGDGRKFWLLSFVSVIWGVVSFLLLVVLSVAAAVIVPRVVRSELSGIASAAERAKQIDGGVRGTRLPIENVPEEVRALVDAVNDGLERLDDAHQQRERFIADAAHELRTPIAILQTRLETADPFPEQARLLMDVARMSSLADQLLDLQRLDLGDTRMSDLDLVELADNVVADMAPLALAAGYEIELDAPPSPVAVLGEEHSLTRALANVVQNAIIHGNQSGRIEIKVRSSGEITVSDEGPGVSMEEREKIFEPFYRLKPQASGAGLGLNLVATIVKRHNGRVAVTSNDAGGASFVINLPVIKGLDFTR